MLHVRLLGIPGIDAQDGRGPDVRGKKPWALFARIVLTGHPLSRRQLAEELFGEADDPLGALRWSLASLRKTFGNPDVFTGDPVSRALPDHVTVDVVEVLSGRGEPPTAVMLLDGVEPPSSAAFETWLMVTRHQVAARIAERHRERALAAIGRYDFREAIEFAELGVRCDPFDEPAHVLLVRSLVLAGDDAAALEHVVRVEELFQRELGAAPTAALRSAARPTTSAPPPGVSLGAVVQASLDAGRAALVAGAAEAGLDCLRRAVSQSEDSGDRALNARVLSELGGALVHTVRGFDDEGVMYLQQAAERAEQVDDVDTLVKALCELGYADVIAGRRPAAAALLERARGLADGNKRLLAAIEAYDALNETDWGHHDSALGRFEAALEAARSSDSKRWEGWALGIGGWAWLRTGDPHTAAEWAGRCLQIVDELRWVSFRPWATCVRAEASAGAGRPDDMYRAVEQGFAVSCQIEDPCWEGANARMLALHHSALGDHEAAMEWIGEARRRASRASDTWTGLLGSILLTEAEVRDAAGDGAGRERTLRDLVALSARAHLDAHLDAAVTLLAAPLASS